MPEYGVRKQPFQVAQEAPMVQKALYGILNALYGSDAMQDAPLDMMMPLGGMARQGAKAGIAKLAPKGHIPTTVNRGNRVGPMVNGELLPMARTAPVSPTAVSPFELQQLGLSKGAPPYKMGSK